MIDPAELPLLTAELPGTGGELRSVPADFIVDEIPAYGAVGDGEHLFLRVEKEARTTDEVRRELARVLKIRPDDVGIAGLKDKHAITRQWMSVPADTVSEEEARTLSLRGARILEGRRHRNKLRTGHLRGNRFAVRIRGVEPDGLERAWSKLTVLDRRGVPNYYGEQRFGTGGETVAIGLAALRGERTVPGSPTRRIDRGLRRLGLSAVQSDLFNRLLADRLRSGGLHTVESGDVMQVVATGGSFVAEDAAREQVRFDAGETVITGPMFGPKSLRATGAPGQREDAMLASSGLDPSLFAKQGKLMLGTRRPYLVRPAGIEAGPDEDVPGAIWVRFSLPAGSYATIVLREIMEPAPRT
jgi:tRNA pseudouridine13 synthase